MRRAIFLDRDGVLIKENGYVHKIDDMEIIDGVADAIKKFNDADFITIIVTNQAGVARGLYEEKDTENFNREMIKRLAVQNAKINRVYFCPHHPTEGKVKEYSIICECRKPNPGMLLKAAKEHNIDLRYSWMIGDRDSDIKAGKAAGCRTILISKDAKNLREAADMILKHDKIKSFEGINEIAKKLKKEGKKVVFTNGCFDILHAGHVYYLQEAKNLGDVLIVGLNSDSSVRKIKGPNRPINSDIERTYVLNSLACIDYIVIFEEDDPVKILETIKPSIHVKGGDWKEKNIPERDTIEKNGGKVVFINFLDGYSTTKIIEKIKK